MRRQQRLRRTALDGSLGHRNTRRSCDNRRGRGLRRRLLRLLRWRGRTLWRLRSSLSRNDFSPRLTFKPLLALLDCPLFAFVPFTLFALVPGLLLALLSLDTLNPRLLVTLLLRLAFLLFFLPPLLLDAFLLPFALRIFLFLCRNPLSPLFFLANLLFLSGLALCLAFRPFLVALLALFLLECDLTSFGCGFLCGAFSSFGGFLLVFSLLLLPATSQIQSARFLNGCRNHLCTSSCPSSSVWHWLSPLRVWQPGSPPLAVHARVELDVL